MEQSLSRGFVWIPALELWHPMEAFLLGQWHSADLEDLGRGTCSSWGQKPGSALLRLRLKAWWSREALTSFTQLLSLLEQVTSDEI
jgi:hypothetical protein